MKAPLLGFAPVTRWIVAWPDGAVLRCHTHDGRERGPDLFLTAAAAREAATYLDAGWRPVKVRVTIEVAK